MNDKCSNLQIRIHGIDGSTQAFVQNDHALAERTLRELNPRLVFMQDRVTIADEVSQTTFIPPLITRIDLITDRLSVWDFPFVLGALVELTEAEFRKCQRSLQRQTQVGLQSDLPVILDMEMVSGHHAFLCMDIAAGMRDGRLDNIYCLLKERYLIFDLHVGGIGILNLANLLHFSVYPEPPEATVVAGSNHWMIGRQKRSLTENKTRHRLENRKSSPMHFSPSSRVAIELHEEQ